MQKYKTHYIGIMSGTSLDGIDLALCEIDENSCTLLASSEYDFPTDLKAEILDVISGKNSLERIGELDTRLGILYANALNRFIEEHHIDKDQIEAIGLHGQTLWHAPNAVFPFSMQLGNPNIVASQTQLKSVADFRRMDIANGGQGAPFAPAFHEFLFSHLEGNIAVLNIGGMANVTLLFDELKGWDTGCGNVLMDLFISQTQQKAYDKDGEFARSGDVNAALLEAMLADKYFAKLPPKSTGREYFNAEWLEKHLKDFSNLNAADIQKTLLELTAKTIADTLNATPTTQAVICGGGAKNTFLMQRLSELCKCKVIASDELGVDGDFLEAMAFAWFAKLRVHKQKAKLSSVTGAKKDSILGAIYE
jgi:anhydro-N-acetylmuramic acid kinase